jgi:hypothetical protein
MGAHQIWRVDEARVVDLDELEACVVAAEPQQRQCHVLQGYY